MLNLACEHKNLVARGYENNINSYPDQPKPIMQRWPRRKRRQQENIAVKRVREMKETELHAGPIEGLLRTH